MRVHLDVRRTIHIYIYIYIYISNHGHSQTAKFKFANILVSRFSDKIAKFFARQYFGVYGILGPSTPSESVQTIFFDEAMSEKPGLEMRLKFVMQHYPIPCAYSLITQYETHTFSDDSQLPIVRSVCCCWKTKMASKVTQKVGTVAPNTA